MIKTVEINNFKSISNFHLSNLTHINLFGGKNNAGKTTFLEALFLFHDRLNPNMLLRQYNWRGVDQVSVKADTLFAPIFKNFDLNSSITIRVINRNGQTESLQINTNDDNNKIVQVEVNEGQIKTDSDIVSLYSLELNYRKNEGTAQKTKIMIQQNGLAMEVSNAIKPEKQGVFLASKAHGNPHENSVRFGELDIKGQSQIIIDFLKIVEPNLRSLTSVALQDNTSMLYGDIGIGPKVPISYMGEGTSRLLSILLAIANSRNGIVFIDEIENGIHYSVLHKIWEVIGSAAKEFNCQIFATTHSYECLAGVVKGMPQEMKDEFKYYRFERNENRRIINKEFNFEVLQAAVERGWEVR